MKNHLIIFSGAIFLSLSPAVFSQQPEVVESTIFVKQNTNNLVLYINPDCPYCKKVTNYLKSQNRSIPTKNTQDRGVRSELIAIGGKGQVPCLVINGKALYESDAIIDWLRKNP